MFKPGFLGKILIESLSFLIYMKNPLYWSSKCERRIIFHYLIYFFVIKHIYTHRARIINFENQFLNKNFELVLKDTYIEKQDEEQYVLY